MHLLRIQLCVRAIFFEQFGVGADLDNAPVPHHHDPARIADGGQAVRHHERCAVTH